MKRLTVHLTNVKPVRSKSGKNKDMKTLIFTTKTVNNLKTEQDIADALSEIRKKHKIAIAEKAKGCWKAGQEMYHIANQK